MKAVHDRPARLHALDRSVKQFDLDGNVIKEWPTLQSAIKSIKCHKSAMLSACDNETELKKSYWAYSDLDSIDGEEWKEYKKTTPTIWVSSMGRVKFAADGSAIKGDSYRGQYLVIELRGVIHYVHHLVYDAFIDTDLKENMIAHIDKFDDNRLCNLKLVEMSEPDPKIKYTRDKRVRQYTENWIPLAEFKNTGIAERTMRGLCIGAAIEKGTIAGGFRWKFID